MRLHETIYNYVRYSFCWFFVVVVALLRFVVIYYVCYVSPEIFSLFSFVFDLISRLIFDSNVSRINQFNERYNIESFNIQSSREVFLFNWYL